ncbi:BAR domain-containing protein [Ehrlichia muris]|uniref:hypothetical protein n=1 Tax=Ehrlichia muris TaxID=35795 RepID=UPI0004139C15|nr:hypothetical protein [Ehrlichia muris]
MKLKEANMNGVLVLCFAPIIALYHKIKVLCATGVLLLDQEESSYLRAVMIGCLSVVLCCIIYIMILIHFNIKLMLFLLSKITGKNLKAFNNVISRLIDVRIIHFIILHMHSEFLKHIFCKNKLNNKYEMYQDLAHNTGIIIKSIEHHKKLYENFILPI